MIRASQGGKSFSNIIPRNAQIKKATIRTSKIVNERDNLSINNQ
jgi:hypothetical protein